MDAMRSVEYRLYPTVQQEGKFNLFRLAVGAVFNNLNEYCSKLYSNKEKLPTEYQLISLAGQYRNSNEWMLPVATRCVSNAASRVHWAYGNYFAKVKKGLKAGLPKNRSSESMNSFTYKDSVGYRFANEKDNLPNLKYVWLGNIGFVKYRNDYRPHGKMKCATVIRKKEGKYYKWYLSVTYDLKDYEYAEFALDGSVKRVIGIDMGLESRLAASDGEIVKTNHDYDKMKKRLSRLHGRLSNLEKGSEEYIKINSRLSHIYTKIRNYRADDTHKISRRFALDCSLIALEKLNVSEMIGKSMSSSRRNLYRDASWTEVIKEICYKSSESACRIVFVPAEFTSQLCSRCGIIVKKDLNVRVHRCWNCGFMEDRDINAAINILKRGLGLQTMGNQNGEGIVKTGINPKLVDNDPHLIDE